MGFFGKLRRLTGKPHRKNKDPAVITVYTTQVSPAKTAVNKLFAKFAKKNQGLHARAEKANEYLREIARVEPDITKFAETAGKKRVEQVAEAINTQLQFNKALLKFLERKKAPVRAIEQLKQEIELFESSLKSIQ